MPLLAETPHLYSLVRLRRFGSISCSLIHIPRNEEVTKAFGSLSCTPLLAAVQDNMADIELFINHCYGQTDVLSVNEARFQIFTLSVSGNLRELPLSRSSLTLHVMRSAYQSGWILDNTVSKTACRIMGMVLHRWSTSSDRMVQDRFWCGAYEDMQVQKIVYFMQTLQLRETQIRLIKIL